MSEVDTAAPEEWKKYSEYTIPTDPDQDDKATTIKLCSLARPHMRAFHCNWIGFFTAFFIWFAISPLLSEIRDTLGLTKQEIWTSSIIGVGGTIFMRFLLGPLCDKFGPRIPFTVVLCFAAIPCGLTGLINGTVSLYIIRALIGVAGGSFVMCQFWTSRMFSREVVGTANGMVAGWGNVGGGVTHLVVGSALFPLFKLIFNGDSELAWRTVCVVPAVFAICVGISIYYASDDSPHGNYSEMKKNGTMAEVSAANSFRSGALNFNTWIMFVQYACSFGMELTMYNAAALYFKDEFGQSTESAAAIASLFGWMNLFSRGTGGWISDKGHSYCGMRGRLWVQFFFLVGEGIMMFVFAHTATLGGAIAAMIIFSLFVQAACGTTFGIVPFVDPPSTGSISGIVGAGGNVGAVCFGLVLRQLDYRPAFIIMGCCIFGAALTTAFVFIKGHAGLIMGRDDIQATKPDPTLEVPVPDPEKAIELDGEKDKEGDSVETEKEEKA